MNVLAKWLSVLLMLGTFSACNNQEVEKTYAPDTARIKYLNRETPGERLSLSKELFIPNKMNILYLYTET